MSGRQVNDTGFNDIQRDSTRFNDTGSEHRLALSNEVRLGGRPLANNGSASGYGRFLQTEETVGWAADME